MIKLNKEQFYPNHLVHVVKKWIYKYSKQFVFAQFCRLAIPFNSVKCLMEKVFTTNISFIILQLPSIFHFDGKLFHYCNFLFSISAFYYSCLFETETI